LIRIIPAEGSIQVAPSDVIKGGFFMFQYVFQFFISKVTEDGETSFYPTFAGNVAIVVLIVLIFIAMLVISGRMKKKPDAKQLAFSAVAITLTVITALMPLVQFPFGGSITFFHMFFICFIGYLYGPKVGVLTGIAYGFLDIILDPYIIHPVQMLLDYPIAYGCLGLSGLFSKARYGMVKGYVLGVFGRFVCHTLTGVIFFSSYAGSQNPLIYSVIYNGSYIAPEAVITILLLSIPALQRALGEVKKMAVEK
jgi:thiamine transporter